MEQLKTNDAIFLSLVLTVSGNFNLFVDTKLLVVLTASTNTRKSLKLLKSKKHITLVEGGKVLTDDAKIAETLNSFFGNIVNKLNIEKDESIFCDTGDETDTLLRAMKK